MKMLLRVLSLTAAAKEDAGMEESVADESGWTDGKLLALKYVSFFPGLLSILGSACLVYHILCSKQQHQTTKHRLLLGLSVFDISSSYWVTFGAALVPSRSRSYCQLQGFFAQMANVPTYYTAFLSVYFLLRVRYNITDEKIQTSYEPWFHTVSLLYPLVTAVACIPLGLYNPVFIGCHIEAYPQGCNRKSDIECERGSNALWYSWTFTMVPIFVIMATVLSSQALLYWTVRRQIRSNLRYSVAQRSNEQRMVKLVLEQSFCYVAAFMIPFLLPTIATVIELFQYGGLSDAKFFPLFLLMLFLYPLQGFFNCLVYLRQKYLDLVRTNQEMSRWRCLWFVVVSPNASSTLRKQHWPGNDGVEQQGTIGEDVTENP